MDRTRDAVVGIPGERLAMLDELLVLCKLRCKALLHVEGMVLIPCLGGHRRVLLLVKLQTQALHLLFEMTDPRL
jgi:hypothetical protein